MMDYYGWVARRRVNKLWSYERLKDQKRTKRHMMFGVDLLRTCFGFHGTRRVMRSPWAAIHSVELKSLFTPTHQTKHTQNRTNRIRPLDIMWLLVLFTSQRTFIHVPFYHPRGHGRVWIRKCRGFSVGAGSFPGFTTPLPKFTVLDMGANPI